MTTDEAKRLVKSAVNEYQSRTGKKTYLQTRDYFFYAGALAYSRDDFETKRILEDVRLTLEGTEPYKPAY